jgi:ElaB/YqjD/DUF883 family membrane-anchored ribosome-binding protein
MAADSPALPRLNPELEQSRESAARLLDALAGKLRHLARKSLASRTEPPAHHVGTHAMRDAAAGLGSFVRRQPAAALSIAVAAGFLLGRVLGRRVFR